MKAIHQFVAGFNAGDAISNEALALRALFRRRGYAAEIFCEPNHTAPAMRGDARDATRAAEIIGPDDSVLLHLSIGSAVNDIFAGAVPQQELTAYYEASHLFLCMSEHEGFCIPLIESMAHNLPVLAYAAAAVPETLDGAGVLVCEKHWDYIAEMMGCLTRRGLFREAVVRSQQQRLARYQARNPEQELMECLAPLLGKAEGRM